MPTTHWKGMISFGLVTIPVMLYPAQNKQATISFHQIDKHDNERIQYQRINSRTGKKVPWEDIIRGYEFDKDTIVPVPDEVLKKVAGEKAKTIDIEAFVNQDDIDMLTLENVYYLVPEKNGMKGYVILREALASTGKAGIAKVIISTKEYLSAVMVKDNALVLCLLRYDKEMRKLADVDLPEKDMKKYKVTSKEIDIAKQLIKSMTNSKWRPEKYKDEYQEAIHQWVEETARHLPHHAKKKSAGKMKPTANFIDLLKKSLVSTKAKGKRKTAAEKQPKIIRHKHRHVSASKAIH